MENLENNVVTEEVQAQETKTEEQVKTFTQEEVNEMIAKRIARETTRKAINELKNLKLVIVIKYNSKDQKFEILEKELLSIFKTIVLRQPKGEFNENKKNI